MYTPILEKEIISEDISDLGRDVIEAFNPEFNAIIKSIPVDKYGLFKGRFKVRITWEGS